MVKLHRVLPIAVGVAALLATGVACKEEKGLRITSVEPKSGPYTGGDPVTIHGSGFQSGGAMGVEVWFGDKKGKNVRFRGDDELVVDPPPGEIGETVDITIMFDDARNKAIPKSYTYIDPAAGFSVDTLVEGKEE